MKKKISALAAALMMTCGCGQSVQTGINTAEAAAVVETSESADENEVYSVSLTFDELFIQRQDAPKTGCYFNYGHILRVNSSELRF